MPNYNYQLYPTQYNFMTCCDPFTAFIAGIGSGKTTVGALKAVLKSARPGTLGMIVAPSYRMLKDSTLRTFREVAGDSLAYEIKGDMIAVMSSGAEILLRSADNPESLRGPNLNWVWIDEAGLCAPGTWEIVIGRIRAGGEMGDVWITATPKGKQNWMYKQAQHMTMFRASTLENPHTSSQWKRALIETYQGSFLRQEVFGDFVSFDGLVYNMFDRSIHVKARPMSDFLDYVLLVDEGYTHPATITKLYIARDGSHHIGEEWYETGKLHSQIVQAALDMGMPGDDMVVDEAAAGLRAAFRDAGFNARPGKGRVLDGINKVQEELRIRKRKDGTKYTRLTVDPGCVHTINEFESYIWKEGKDEPVKEFDHILDPVRYYFAGQKKPKVAKQTKVY